MISYGSLLRDSGFHLNIFAHHVLQSSHAYPEYWRREVKTCAGFQYCRAVLFSVVVRAPGVNNMYFFTYCFVTEITRSILSQILRKWAHYNPRDEENKLFKNLSNIWRFEKSDFLGSMDCK
jgi:hypothetical protein